jgi:DNA-binding transcriptional LysR family regulator
MDRFHRLEVFVAVVDADGFAGAAHQLGLSPPAVTRAANELETRLVLRLLTRTTRAVRVTGAGARHAEDARRILAALQEADASASDPRGAPRGLLRVTALALFGALHVTPIVADCLQRVPGTSVSCLFLDRVGEVWRVICASPDHLARQGTPLTPQELLQHVLIAAPAVTPTQAWRLREGAILHAVNLEPRLTTPSNESARAAALLAWA